MNQFEKKLFSVLW